MNGGNPFPVLGRSSKRIRPMRILSEDMELQFVQRQIPESTHFRFLGSVEELPAAVIRKLLESEVHHSIAFLATVEEDGFETQVGFSCCGTLPESNTCEMSLAIAGEDQSQGLGSALANQMIDFARGHGIQWLYAMDLEDDAALGTFAAELGMTSRYDQKAVQQVIGSLRL
jgi:N-acetylglutamate synthase-like GNAT family acetyltransferase